MIDQSQNELQMVIHDIVRNIHTWKIEHQLLAHNFEDIQQRNQQTMRHIVLAMISCFCLLFFISIVVLFVIYDTHITLAKNYACNK